MYVYMYVRHSVATFYTTTSTFNSTGLSRAKSDDTTIIRHSLVYNVLALDTIYAI